MSKIKNKDNWIYKVFFLTFFLSLGFSSLSNIITNNSSTIVMIIIALLVIIIGIIFDMIGTATLSANEVPFHAKSSKKIKGAKESLYLIRNAVKVSSICNDVIGDICGIVSGAMGAIIAINISVSLNINIVLSTTLIASIISSLTVGGKAIFKRIAIKNCDDIVFMVGKVKSIFSKNN